MSRERQTQRFMVAIPAPRPEQAELVSVAEFEAFVRRAFTAAAKDLEDTDSLYYVPLPDLEVSGL